jgi:hypothetical protein
MSNFKDKEETASVYHMTDNDGTKKTTRNASADFTIDIFIIRRGEEKAELLGEEIGEYVANVDAKYTNAENIRQGDEIVWNGKDYIVINKPRYNNLFGAYKVLMNDTND